MVTNWKRILAGLVVAYLLGQAATFLLPTFSADGGATESDINLYVSQLFAVEIIVSFAAFAAGGFVARQGFVIPALIYVGLAGVWNTCTGARRGISAAEEMTGYSVPLEDVLRESLGNAVLMLLVSMIVVAIAAMVGMKLSRILAAGKAVVV